MVKAFETLFFFSPPAPQVVFFPFETFPLPIYAHLPIPLAPTYLLIYTFKFKIDSLPPTYSPIYLKCDTLIPTYLPLTHLFTYLPALILAYLPFHLPTY
jgi:hypothetical protein